MFLKIKWYDIVIYVIVIYYRGGELEKSANIIKVETAAFNCRVDASWRAGPEDSRCSEARNVRYQAT